MGIQVPLMLGLMPWITKESLKAFWLPPVSFQSPQVVEVGQGVFASRTAFNGATKADSCEWL